MDMKDGEKIRQEFGDLRGLRVPPLLPILYITLNNLV